MSSNRNSNNRGSRGNCQRGGRVNSNSNENDHRNSNRNNSQRSEDAPITYERMRIEHKEVTIRVPSSATEKEKKYVPLYDGTLNKESYLIMVNEFSVLIESYPLMRDPARMKSTINSFRDCIRSTAKTQFNSLCIAGVNATYATFQADVWALTELILGPTALRKQLAYLRRTQKLNNHSIPEWLARIEAINTLLPYFAINTNERSANEIVSKIIAPNLPYNIRNSFDLVYRPNDTMVQIIRTLTLLSNREQHREPRGNNRGGNNNNNNNNNNNSSQRNGNRNNGNGRGKQFKNECGVHGGHEWSDCRTNPNNKKGKTRTTTPRPIAHPIKIDTTNTTTPAVQAAAPAPPPGTQEDAQGTAAATADP